MGENEVAVDTDKVITSERKVHGKVHGFIYGIFLLSVQSVILCLRTYIKPTIILLQ